MQTAKALIDDHGLDASAILILEAQDYIGGRVKQDSNFIKGMKVELGAEILHGDNTKLTQYAKNLNETIVPAFCWAHGDGGPFETAVNGLYGLYFVGHGDNRRILRYDDSEPEFCRLNQCLKDIGHIDEMTINDQTSLNDYLVSQGFSKDMLALASAGFSNTFCAASETMSFKQAVRNTRLWHGDEEDDKEFNFKNSYSVIVNHLKRGLNIKLNTPVKQVDNSEGYFETQQRHPIHSTNHNSSSATTTAISSSTVVVSPSPVESESPTPSVASDGHRELVRVTTTDGTLHTARCCVVTSSPKVLLSDLIKFNPPLSDAKIDGLKCVDMHPAMKIIFKFTRRFWPKNLQGMIMSCDNCVCPEMWFKEVPNMNDQREKLISIGESTYVDNDTDLYEGTCTATGFATAKSAEKLQLLSEEELYRVILAQMDEVVSKLSSRHMSSDPTDEDEKPEDLPRPSSVFIKAMVQDWSKQPYIGGGYSCGRIGWNLDKGRNIAEAIDVGNSGAIFFAGEATNISQPGGTAHSALETGDRAADEVSAYLDEYFDD